MDLKVSLDYVQTEESRYRKNAAIQIRQEVANVLKHARLSTEEESAAPAPAAEEKTGKEAAAGKTSAARSEKKAEAASEKKPFEKKPFEKKGKWGDFRGGFRKDPNPDVIYGRDFEDELFHWKILCRKWERLSSAARLWMWKREKSEMRRPY